MTLTFKSIGAYMKSTLEYYNKNFTTLIKRYEEAKPKEIHSLLIQYINKEDSILELGFGSGRELNFLYKQGYKNLYGIDGSLKFVEYVQKRFSNKNNFTHSILPQININGEFNFIYSIAVIMHLPHSTYKELVKNIANKSAKNAKILFSFSLGARNDKERNFYEVNESLLEKLFQQKSIFKEKEFISQDSLNREIKWKNIIYKRAI